MQTDKISALQSTLSTFWYPVESNLRPRNAISPDNSAWHHISGRTGVCRPTHRKQERHACALADSPIPAIAGGSNSESKSKVWANREPSRAKYCDPIRPDEFAVLKDFLLEYRINADKRNLGALRMLYELVPDAVAVQAAFQGSIARTGGDEPAALFACAREILRANWEWVS